MVVRSIIRIVRLRQVSHVIAPALPGENRCLHPLDEPGGQGVTAFGNSLPSFQAPSLSQKSGKRLVNTHIGVDAELGPEFQKKFHFWNFGSVVTRVTISRNADYV